MQKHISIQFCGGCNSRINRSYIAAKIKDEVTKWGHEFSYNCLEADVIIFMSGCSAGCAKRNKNSTASEIIVAGATVDTVVVKEAEIYELIVDKIRQAIL